MISKVYSFILVKVRNFLKAVDYNREKGSFSRILCYGLRVPPEFIAGFITFWIFGFVFIVLIILVGSLIGK